ncbi:MAG: hypothetical protein K6B68_00140 [Eubacterium sp.]|nr:hypothetical protein [Eubacterium sp.]
MELRPKEDIKFFPLKRTETELWYFNGKKVIKESIESAYQKYGLKFVKFEEFAEKGTRNEHVTDVRYILMGICDRFPAMSGTYVLQQQIPADDYVYIFSDDDYISDIAVYFSELVKEEDSYEMLVKKSKAAAIRYEQMKQIVK